MSHKFIEHKCELCRLKFNSENQLHLHNISLKHLRNVNKIRANNEQPLNELPYEINREDTTVYVKINLKQKVYYQIDNNLIIFACKEYEPIAIKIQSPFTMITVSRQSSGSHELFECRIN